MSYPQDIDEMRMSVLTGEIDRRKILREHGQCTYCERPINSFPSCKLVDRHKGQES
jgi:hypothetical protein